MSSLSTSLSNYQNYQNVAALKLLEGGGRRGEADSKYREVAWKLEERGNMGENLVGVCLLQGTAVHNQLARRLINTYPKLVNDIFISENYYGKCLLKWIMEKMRTS